VNPCTFAAISIESAQPCNDINLGLGSKSLTKRLVKARIAQNEERKALKRAR